MRDISQQVHIIFSPELLCLFEQESWLNFWIIFRRILVSPPLFAPLSFRELGQFAAMESDCYFAELGSVFGDHFSSTILVKFYPSHFRGRHVRKHAEGTILSFLHSRVTVRMISHVAFHLLEVFEHLLPSYFREIWLWNNFWLRNEGESWCFDFVLLILDHICQINLFASILSFKLDSLLNRGEPWFFNIKFAVDVRFISRSALLALDLELLVLYFNFFAVRVPSHLL